jgi:hypothetical protein
MQWFLTEPEGRRDILDRDSMNDRASAARGRQTRELTEAALDAVSGGVIISVEKPTASIQWSGSGGAGDRPTAIIAVL